MATQDKFNLRRVRIQDEKVDSNPTTVTTYLLGLLIAVVAGIAFGLVSLLLIATTKEISIVLYLLVSVLVCMSPRLLLRKFHNIYTTAICMLPPIISLCILFTMIEFENSTDIIVIGALSVIMGIVGGWIKLERKGGNTIIIQKD